MHVTKTDDATPSELHAEVAQNHAGLTSAVLSRRHGNHYVPFCSIGFDTAEGVAVDHQSRPQDRPEDIAAKLGALCIEHARSNGGTGWYQAELTVAKPARGSAAKPRRVSFLIGGDRAAVDDTRELYRDALKSEREHSAKLVDQIVALVSATSDVMRGVVEGHAAVTERERAIAKEGAEMRAVELEHQASLQRTRTFEKMLAPAGDLIRSQFAPPPPTSGPNDARTPLVRLAHQLHASFDDAQWSTAREVLPSAGPLERLGAAANDADVLGCVTDILALSNTSLQALYERVLNDEQRALVLQLQNAAAAAASAQHGT
jgi:hypothetical protein